MLRGVNGQGYQKREPFEYCNCEAGHKVCHNKKTDDQTGCFFDPTLDRMSGGFNTNTCTDCDCQPDPGMGGGAIFGASERARLK